MRALLLLCFCSFLFSARAQVVINEVGITPSANNAAQGGEFIELYNAGSCPVNIGCYIVFFSSASSSSGNANGWTITIPANTILQPCAYYLIGGAGATPGTSWTSLATGGNAWTNSYGTNGSNTADLDISTSANTGLNGLRPGNLSDSRGQVSLLLPNGGMLTAISYSNTTIQGNNPASYTGSFNKAPSGCTAINPIANPGNAPTNIINYSSSTHDGIYLDATGNYQVATSLTPGRSNALIAGGSQITCVPFPPPGYSLTQPTCVLPTGTITANAVPGFGYSINGTDYSNTTGIFANLPPGTYPLSHRGPSGCTSAPVMVTLLPPPSAQVQTQNLNGCGSVVYNGLTYTASTTVRDTIRSVSNCDSIIRLVQIAVRPAVHSYPTQCLAPGQTFVFNGQTLAASGTYLDTLASAQGCDSIVHLRLTVARQETTALSGCGSVVFNGLTYTASVIVRDTVRSTLTGCDSLVRITNIRIGRPSPVTQMSGCLLSGSGYLFFGQTLNQPGMYTQVLTNAQGCDSLVRLQLYLTRRETLSLEGCNSVVYGGTTYQGPATLQERIPSALSACDSILRTVEIRVRSCGEDIYLPSAFTPNGDGLNDELRVLGADVASMELSVFNRWGQLVFQTRVRSRGWDGTLGGKEQASGSFVYLLKAVLPDGRKVQRQGTVALIR